jgi:GntR family transcriptional repressor for pyruvate dehydrogenase complex
MWYYQIKQCKNYQSQTLGTVKVSTQPFPTRQKMLKPVKQKKISDQIYEQIRDMIYRGEYRPGQKLMTERDMASFFRVGRPTVRTAIQKLIDNELIVSRRGVGTFVLDEKSRSRKKPLLEILNDEDFTISEFQEIRMTLELKSAELAAQRATEEDLLLIEQSLDRITLEKETGNAGMGSDISFHMNIAYAGKNIVLIQLMKSFYDAQYTVMDLAYNELFQSLGIDEIIDRQHRSIAEAIKSRNPEMARSAMQEHLGTILKNCR